MTNDAIWAVVITGKYAVRSSPREKRNTDPATLHVVLPSVNAAVHSLQGSCMDLMAA